MSYACFVKDVYECIKRYSDNDAFSLSVFAEGPEALKPEHSGTQEYAVFRNDYARMFFDIVSALEKQYMPESRAHKLEESRLMPGEVRITHSCYPRNLRRWMNDTISRKQRCRAELCALIWCWYASWLEEVNPEISKDEVARSLMEICSKYTEGHSFCLGVLWNACTSAYRNGSGKDKV
ncbi:MAG: hypothetical protein IJ820_03370 [Lachnospiraceae bacterium]|nr:hypothetical protein [Lachnospiraceae bacterium]